MRNRLAPTRTAAAAVLTLGMLVTPAAAPTTVSLEVQGRSNATPSVAASGTFVAVAWGASTPGRSDVFVAVSRDGGISYGAPVQVNRVRGEARLGGELPPRVALKATGRSSDPDIAVLWTARGDLTEIKTAWSRDGGKSFAAPVTLQSAAAPGDRGWPALTLDRQGTAHAVWLDHRGIAARGTSGGGHHASGRHAGMSAANSGLYYASVGGTGTASRERELTKSVCYCCKTALAAGPNGAIYAAWRHVYAGDIRDIAFTVSRNGGRTFAPPVRVSEDKWQINGCPDDGPAMAVDRAGVVHVVWPTVLGGEKPEGAIFYASTRDGRRFTPRLRIPTLGGPKPAHPQIVFANDGRVAVAWDETVNGRRVAAIREIKPARQAFGEIVTLDTEGPGMFPALAAVGDGLVAVWTAGADPARVQARAIRLP